MKRSIRAIKRNGSEIKGTVRKKRKYQLPEDVKVVAALAEVAVIARPKNTGKSALGSVTDRE